MMKDNEKGREKHEMKDRDDQPKGERMGGKTPGIKMGAYKNGTEHHDCSRD